MAISRKRKENNYRGSAGGKSFENDQIFSTVSDFETIPEKGKKCKQMQKHSVKPKGPPTRSVLVPSYKTRDELLTEHGMLQRYDVEFCIRDRGTRLHPEVQAG